MLCIYANKISEQEKTKSKIPVTIHDLIVKFNKAKNDRREEELLQKMADYNIETVISFVGTNRVDILIFD